MGLQRLCALHPFLFSCGIEVTPYSLGIPSLPDGTCKCPKYPVRKRCAGNPSVSREDWAVIQWEHSAAAGGFLLGLGCALTWESQL